MEQLIPNTYVRYGANGICMVVGQETRLTERGQSDYYILKPVAEDQTTICIPVDNPTLLSRVSPMPCKEDIRRMIRQAGTAPMQWEADRNARAKSFAAILKDGDPLKLLLLVRCIYLKRRELAQVGKKLSSSDEGALKRAERSLERDLSFVLGIRENEVGSHIRQLLELND